MAIVRFLREWAVLWLGLIGFILVMGALRGATRGLSALDDFGPLLMGALFVGTMVALGIAFARFVGWMRRLFKRA